MLVSERYIWADDRVVINNNGPDLINSAGILAIHFLWWSYVRKRVYTRHNNPEEPKILCVGNNPDRQNIYGAALGLYNSRIVKLINKKGLLKSSDIIDELPTIYFKGLDNLIATARSNKVAVCLGFQDFSQLVRDYGDKEAKVVRP